MSITLRPLDNGILESGVKHRFVFAHQDDDLGYSGLLQRIRPDSKVLWVTNGDGLAPMAGIEPLRYASMRNEEASAALGFLGYPRDALHFLGYSEIEMYDDFVEAEKGKGPIDPNSDLGRRLRARLEKILEELVSFTADADVVWVNAWQGGHPEHDLVHYLTARAVNIHRRSGRDVRFMELPQYEMLFFVPLRFAPWHKGVAHVIELDPQELHRKFLAFGAYKSQKEITEAFKKLLTLYGVINALRLRPFTFKQYASKEYFGPVPANRDYSRAPHGTDLLEYINEKHEGTKVSFTGAVGRFIQLME